MSVPVALSVLDFPLHGSRLIEASAGTGKTFTIALLYVRLVLDHGGEAAFGRALTPPEILVVTFTDAATQELRDRIRARLTEAARCFGEPDAAHDGLLEALRDSYPHDRWPACARLLRLAAEWMDEAAVSTIHAWCYRMLREHAFDSGSLFAQELATDQGELLLEVVRDYWRRNFYALSPREAGAVRTCFAGPDDLAAALKPLLARTDVRFFVGEQVLHPPASLAHVLAPAAAWQEACESAANAARHAWASDREALEIMLHALRPSLHGNVYRNKDDDATFTQWVGDLAAWSEGAAAPANLAKFGQTRIKLKAKAVTPRHPAFQAIDQWADVADGEPQIKPLLLLHALSEVRATFDAEKIRRAELGFDDLLARLDRALAGQGGDRLAARIREQFPVALIDEFQDTDPLQYRIFERVYRIADNPREIGLFMIGDPKQAIYAFRGADIHTYLRARTATLNRHYTLSTNYRSTRDMVEAANRCFAFAEQHPRGAFRFGSDEVDNPVPFQPVEARGREEVLLIDGVPATAMTFWLLDNGGAVCGASAYRDEMAERCASAVRGWLAQAREGRAGFREPDGSLRPLQPADIAILVRGRREADAIRTSLAARRLASVYLSDRDSVFATEEAGDVLQWLRACADPTDDGALRRALATRSLGLGWPALERLNRDERFWEDTVMRFRGYRTLWQTQGVLPMLRRLLADFDVPASLLREADGERRLTNLLHLAEWLQRQAVEADGEHALLRVYAEQIERPSEEEILRLESDADLIKVITIHKSKGLEYPLVLLPFICTWRELDGRSRELPSFQHGEGRVVDVSGDTSIAGTAYDRANDERLSEDMRLLYVALTRARHAVWLGVAPLVSGRSKSPELHKGAMGYLLGGAQPLSAEDIPARLRELQAGCAAIGIAPAPAADSEILEAAHVAAPGPAREPTRRIAERWWIASYSALAMQAEDGDETHSPSSDEPASADEDVLREASLERLPSDMQTVGLRPLGLHAFPRGSNAGSFLHALLEWAADEGFSALSSEPARIRDQVARRCALRGWDAWIEPLSAWLEAFVRTPFSLPGTSPVRLDALEHYQKEMEFWFSTREVDSLRLDALVRGATLNGAARPVLQRNVLNGMLKGFIDLVFEHQGRYYVADYKSNWLGSDEVAYSAGAMRAAVLDHRYDLQYVLYVFALHRLLRSRLPDYDYERHVGGAVYLFLRGSQSDTQGVHFERPPRQLMDALDALFRDSAEVAA
ncbi:exodeoxyribonuclease V subunit beta [Uliginosibacterium sp. sgz301328]|uniref:exodeoxyribonuclease V subunit beta n=1 Tax=Uliginosibacterium sp. sgz301328 TaxID=3243764 RepID=UPI00359D67BA